jgi:hypothetical protein
MSASREGDGVGVGEGLSCPIAMLDDMNAAAKAAPAPRRILVDNFDRPF